MRRCRYVLAATFALLGGGCYLDFDKPGQDAGDDEMIDALAADGPISSIDAMIDAMITDPPDATPDATIDAMPDAAPDAKIDAAPDAMPDAFVPPILDYATLSETGLYADIANKVLAADIIEFHPAHKLWTDGAGKVRWIWIPPGETIDTSDMDHWKFPIGTKVWKLFTQTDTMGNEVWIETRLIERTGPLRSHNWMGSFEWRDDLTDADFRQFGVIDAKGFDHDIPPADRCKTCHYGEDSNVLGFSAVQLSHGDFPNLTDIAAMGLLSDPPPGGETYPVPGNATEAAALGYMNANCGHCHNPSAGLACNQLTGLSLRVHTTDTTVAMTDAYTTAVDQPLTYWVGQGYDFRIVSGDPDMSAIVHRMSVRGMAQMPPEFTEFVHPEGVQWVTEWIESL